QTPPAGDLVGAAAEPGQPVVEVDDVVVLLGVGQPPLIAPAGPVGHLVGPSLAPGPAPGDQPGQDQHGEDQGDHDTVDPEDDGGDGQRHDGDGAQDQGPLGQ